jgi:hypothetical protein
MKYLQIKEQLLNEINMSTGSLRRTAKSIGALAGMEFEMIVPNSKQDNDDIQEEPDWDYDESVTSIEEARDFFDDRDHNSRTEVNQLRAAMERDYFEWLSEQFDRRWESNESDFIYNYIKENASPEEIAIILGTEPDKDGEYPNPDRQMYRDAVEKILEQGNGMPAGGEYWYDQAYDSAREDFNTNADQEKEWLEAADLNTMRDVQTNYNINWVHYYTPTRDTNSIEDVADSFSRATGRHIESSQTYHSNSITRPSATESHYLVEPDSSIEPDDEDSDDGGLEFVSPALPIDELLDDLKKIKKWADKYGCYTNNTTGLHINVSVPGWDGDKDKLDFVKLAILLGDEYVLEQFGRQGNTYTRSALEIVKNNIGLYPDKVAVLLDQMKTHLNASASKAIKGIIRDRRISINVKSGYIEFRSPGGDWLNSNFDKIESTLLRFVVAMDAAVDETKYKEEYAKKLYELLDPQGGKSKGTSGTGSKDTIRFFTNYAAGLGMPTAALKSFVKQAQLERNLEKNAGTTGEKYWWNVRNHGSNAGIEVVATSKEEAIEKAIGADGYPSWANTRSSLVAKPLRPYVEEEISYEIFNLNTNRSIEPADGITNDADALIRLNDYIEHGPHRLQRGQARDMFGIRRVGDSEPILAQPIRATIGQPQPAGSVGRAATSPTGQWKIIDGLGRQLSVFRPYANTRAAANELAAVWATENNFDGNYQVEPADDQTVTPTPVHTRLDRPFVWKVIGAGNSPYQSQGTEVVAASEFEAMQKARQQWNLNVGGRTEEEFFSTNGWRATPIRPAPVTGSTTDLQQQRQTPGTFTGAWQVLDADTGQELYRFSGVGNVQADANRVAADWLRRNGPEDADMTQIEVVPIMS